MSLNSRQRNKGAQSAQDLIADAQVLSYAVGRAGTNPVPIGAGLAALFVLGSAVMVEISGTSILLPALVLLVVFLLIVVCQHLVSPPRALVVCDRGLVLTDRSLLDGRPTKVLALSPFTDLHFADEELLRSEVITPHEGVWVTRAEDAIVRQAIGVAMTGSSAAYGATAAAPA